MIRIFLITSILLALALPGYAMDKDLKAEITRILEENNTTAASIAIFESDGSWHTLGIGIADKTTERPVDTDTLFRIGSVSKIFTSLSILKLVEEDKLGLNDPILKRRNCFDSNRGSPGWNSSPQ